MEGVRMGPHQQATARPFPPSPHRSDTGDEEAPPTPCPLTEEMSGVWAEDCKKGSAGTPEAGPTSRNEGRNTNPAFRAEPFTEQAVNGALSICQSSLDD